MLVSAVPASLIDPAPIECAQLQASTEHILPFRLTADYLEDIFASGYGRIKVAAIASVIDEANRRFPSAEGLGGMGDRTG